MKWRSSDQVFQCISIPPSSFSFLAAFPRILQGVELRRKERKRVCTNKNWEAPYHSVYCWISDCSYVAPCSGRLCVLQWSCLNVFNYPYLSVFLCVSIHYFICVNKTIRSVTCTFHPQFGRIDPHYPKVCGHQGKVLDIKWNPFHDNIIASCSEDSSVSKILMMVKLVSII